MSLDSSPQSSVTSPSDALIPLASRDVESQGLNKGPIYRVPEDVLLCIFHDIVLPPHSGRHLATLGLVCKHWREMLESAPTLWTYISAVDSLSHVQNALRHTGQAPIDIVYPTDARCKADAFFLLLKDKSRYCRTMDVNFSGSPDALSNVETSYTLFINLFGEPNIPAKLTGLTLQGFSLIIPLWLANLTSLSLRGVYRVTMEDLLRLLQDSPNLKILKLEELFALQPNEAIPHITHLPCLVFLELWLPLAVIRYLLTGFHADALSCLRLICDMDNARPRGELLSNQITHFLPTIREMVSRAAMIRFDFDGCGVYSVGVGDLFLEFDVFPHQNQYSFAIDVFEWLAEELGPEFREIPARLEFDDIIPKARHLELYGSSPQPRVVEIILSDFDTTGRPPISVLQYLGSPRKSDPSQWPFPHLETIKYHLEEYLNDYLVDMLRGRYGDPSQIQQATLQPPQPLKEIRIYGLREGGIAQPNMSFLKEVQDLAVGAKIFWQDELLTFV